MIMMHRDGSVLLVAKQEARGGVVTVSLATALPP
jgi:hypothetical protein